MAWVPKAHAEDHAARHADGGADELDAADLASGAASDGHVLTADGAGGAAWEAVPASALDGLSDVTITTPTTGQVVKYNGSAWVNDTDDTGSGLPTASTKGDIAVYNGSAWVVVSAGANDTVLTANSAQAAGVKWAAGGGSGGVPSDPLYERGDESTAHSDDDEFDTAAAGTPSGFTAVQDSTPRHSFEKRFGRLHVYAQGGITSAQQFEGLLKAIPGTPTAPLTIETAVLLPPEPRNYQMFGLVFTDGTTWGSGTQFFGGAYTDTVSPRLTYRPLSNWVASGTTGETVVYGPGWLFMRLVWVSSNTFRLLYSTNGVTWKRWDSAESVALTLTPTHYGLAFSPWASNANEPTHAAFHCFRVYESAKDEGID